MAHAASVVLVNLGRFGARAPALPDSIFNGSQPRTSTHTLGGLGWAEVEGLDEVQRDVAALSLTRMDAMAYFRGDLATFEFGRQFGATAEPPSTVDASAWSAVHSLLLHARSAIADRRPGECSGSAVFAAGHDPALRSSATWEAAGMPADCVLQCFQGDAMHTGELGALALRCLSTSSGSVLAAAAVIACDTGFNRAPIFCLPRDPVVFRTRDLFGLSSTVFLAAIKRRANHEVVACLEDCRPLLGLLGQAGVQQWNETARELSRRGVEPDQALMGLRENGDLLQLLEDIGRMADGAREIDRDCRTSSRLLVHPVLISRNKLPVASARRAGLSKVGRVILRRPGVTFPAIRATVAAIDYVKGRSTAATARRLCNSTGVAWRAYVPPTRTHEGTVIRFFHRMMEGLVLPGRGRAAAAAGIGGDEAELVLRTVRLTGLAAAIGVEDAPAFGRKNLILGITDEALLAVHLALRAAQHARLELPYDTWHVRCLPLLGLATAITAALADAGHADEYRTVAERVDAALVTGTLGLPPVWVC